MSLKRIEGYFTTAFGLSVGMIPDEKAIVILVGFFCIELVFE